MKNDANLYFEHMYELLKGKNIDEIISILEQNLSNSSTEQKDMDEIKKIIESFLRDNREIVSSQDISVEKITTLSWLLFVMLCRVYGNDKIHHDFCGKGENDIQMKNVGPILYSALINRPFSAGISSELANADSNVMLKITSIFNKISHLMLGKKYSTTHSTPRTQQNNNDELVVTNRDNSINKDEKIGSSKLRSFKSLLIKAKEVVASLFKSSKKKR